MTWFAFQGLNGGQAIDLAGTQEKQAVAEGFHGYATQAQAQANPNSVNVITRTLADTWIADYHAAVAEQAQPGGANANILNPVTAVKAGATGVATEVGNLTGLNALGSFFGGSSAGWLLRTAEIALGLLLIAVGVAKLTNSVPAATAIAKKLGAVGLAA
jgi:hypothetical protein